VPVQRKRQHHRRAARRSTTPIPRAAPDGPITSSSSSPQPIRTVEQQQQQEAEHLAPPSDPPTSVGAPSNGGSGTSAPAPDSDPLGPTMQLSVSVLTAISQVNEEEWDAVAFSGGEVNPFVSWRFLHILEASGSAVCRLGWLGLARLSCGGVEFSVEFSGCCCCRLLAAGCWLLLLLTKATRDTQCP